MRIKGFWKFVDDYHLTPHSLKDCAVVIDGQNLFYNKYKESKLPYAFGSESDRYADYLRKYMTLFSRANVKCYIFFKGGHEDINKKFKSLNDSSHIRGDNFLLCDGSEIVLPIFMKSIYKEVLDELSIDYTVCEFESKRDCIAYAQKNSYPVISFDAEFCFSGVPYIPYTTLEYNKLANSIRCKLFLFDRFINTYRGLNKDKIATFIALADQNLFDENMFMQFFTFAKIPQGNLKRIAALLSYLSRHAQEKIKNDISRNLSSKDKVKFNNAEQIARSHIDEKISEGIPSVYFSNNGNIKIQKNDPKWFEKGITSKEIAIPYSNLYRSNLVMGSGAIADNKSSDPILLSLDIIQYALDLLTDFKNEGFEVIPQQSWLLPNTKDFSNINRTRKPNYVADKCVFENGWDNISSIRLFEHFLEENIKGLQLKQIENFPDDARLLLIAMVYFTMKKENFDSLIIPSILVCYVMLNFVQPKIKNGVKIGDNIPEKVSIETIISADVSESDCKVAADVMAKFFEVTNSEVGAILNRSLLHRLVEFEHCLEELNYLNKLCGSPYLPTKYSKTFNATFVYKIMYTSQKEYENNALLFTRDKLKPATTVLDLFNSLFQPLENIFKVVQKKDG